MNSLFAEVGIASWKPLIAALILPPVPFLLLVLIGARTLLARRGLGWVLVLIGVLGVWLSSTTGIAVALERWLLQPPPALSPLQLSELRERVQARRPIAIVVLGGGRESVAPEYGTPSLTPTSLARLRYGLWLARESGAPLAFSGGVGWAQFDDGPSEAQIAAHIAVRDFNAPPLRWSEEDSRDTRENAARMVQMLKRDGIEEVVLVSHGWHLPRGMRAFDHAAEGKLRITPAPMGMAIPVERPALRWLPTPQGFVRMRAVTHELVGLLAGS
jgi:uncharacterized SAM-binding protein YcdF (DUF218 family)